MAPERTVRPDLRTGSPDGPGVLAPELNERRSRRRLYLAVATAVAIAAAAVAAAAIATRSDGSEAAAEPRTATATVARRDLVQRTTVSGTLGFADARSVLNYRQGTITQLPAEGRVIERGQVLYRIDERPIVLFFGHQPAWRPLGQGVSDGQDVLQLERNLRALGYDEGNEMTVDRHFDWATAAAVERWQKAIGLERTGVVERGDVVFLPGQRRVGPLAASLGDPAGPGTPIMTTTSTGRVVTAAIDTLEQDRVAAGDEVVVDLLNGTTTTGTVSEVGKVATTTDASAGQAQETVISFELNRPRVAGDLDQTPVEVRVTSEKAENVLSVPVSALLALRGGGYAVEVIRAGKPTLVRVEPGLYSDGGFVEISGAVEPGEQVVVPE